MNPPRKAYLQDHGIVYKCDEMTLVRKLVFLHLKLSTPQADEDMIEELKTFLKIAECELKVIGGHLTITRKAAYEGTVLLCLAEFLHISTQHPGSFCNKVRGKGAPDSVGRLVRE